jgi:hypothetical protein
MFPRHHLTQLKFGGFEKVFPSRDLGPKDFGGVCAYRGKPIENSPLLAAESPPNAQNFS